MTGEAPLTRREARDLERAREAAETAAPARRAGTSEPTAGGDEPVLVTAAPAEVEQSVAPAAADVDAQTKIEAETDQPDSIPEAETGATKSDSDWAEPATADDRDDTERHHESRRRSHEAEVNPTEALVVENDDAGDDADGVPSRTLTRRELRAMLATQALETIKAQAPEGEAPVDVIAESSAPVEVEPQQAGSGRRASWTPASEDVSTSSTAQEPRTPEAPVFVAPAPAEPDALTLPSLVPTSESDGSATEWAAGLAPRPSSRARGHWSVDEDLEDVSTGPQSFDQLLSRGSASGGVPTTTSALILPVIPNTGEGIVSLNTGEILVTGSFDLPRSLGSTGAHPDRIDSSEIDNYFDADDGGEAPMTSAQPIRASRAVSSHASTRDVLTPPQKQSRWSVPFVLSISGGVLLVGVVGLVVAGFVSGVL